MLSWRLVFGGTRHMILLNLASYPPALRKDCDLSSTRFGTELLESLTSATPHQRVKVPPRPRLCYNLARLFIQRCEMPRSEVRSHLMPEVHHPDNLAAFMTPRTRQRVNLSGFHRVSNLAFPLRAVLRAFRATH